MADKNDSSKDFYSKAYAGQANNSWSCNPDRLAVVREQVAAVGQPSIAVLDIGCGTAAHTKWVAEKGFGTWTGVDIVDATTIGLTVPEGGRFDQVDLRTNEGWRHPFLQDRYDLVVDQGAVFVSIENDAERDRFLQRVANTLKPGGRFVGLMLEGPYGVFTFPDGRKRMRMTEDDVTALAQQWEVTAGLRIVTTHLHWYEPGNFNPLPFRIGCMHIIFEKV